MTPKLPELSLLETRVLGVLVEKQRTVPDTYPLTLNALAAGCGQKTSRDPVMSVTDVEVRVTVDRLRSLSLVVESSGERVMRYAHNIERVLDVPSQAVALLATLMLRGPQTVGELRINSDRLHSGRACRLERVRAPPRRRIRCAQAPGRDAARRTRRQGLGGCGRRVPDAANGVN